MTRMLLYTQKVGTSNTYQTSEMVMDGAYYKR